MYKLTIYVTLKRDVLDPQGKAISEAASSLGIKNILDIKQGKYFEVLLINIYDKYLHLVTLYFPNVLACY